MRVFHVTDAAAALAILAEGFRDGTGSFMLEDFELCGVWVSADPLTANEGAWGDTVLEIEIVESDIAEFEVIEEGKPYREWCVPAAVLNRGRVVRRSDEDS